MNLYKKYACYIIICQQKYLIFFMVANQTLKYFIKIVKSEKALSKKEKDILVARLQKKTLEKIGKKYKLTAERIRQIEEDAVKKFLKKINQLFLFD